jgi:hypothetical protein
MTATLPPGSLRDGQVRSAFATILETLLASTIGIVAAVLVDEEGEAVDHAGALPAWHAKVAAAHWQIVLRDLSASSAFSTSRCVIIRAERFGYVLRQLFGGYVLVLVCRPHAVSSVSARALRQVELELADEAGFTVGDAASSFWTRVQVILGPDRLPVELRQGDRPAEGLQILAPAAGLAQFELGYRVRAASGRELLLVREPSGVWYAGQPGD